MDGDKQGHDFVSAAHDALFYLNLRTSGGVLFSSGSRVRKEARFRGEPGIEVSQGEPRRDKQLHSH